MQSLIFQWLLLGILSLAKESVGVKIDMAKFKNENVLCHNNHREKHGVNPLSYNNKLNTIAQKYAEKLAEIDTGLKHSGNGYGENLYRSNGRKVDGYAACNSWYNEIKFYHFIKGGLQNDHQVGHFTQLVWKGSCFMGIGVATSEAGWTYVVTNYDPPGNVIDNFPKNVFPAGTQPFGLSQFQSLITEDQVVCTDDDSNSFRKHHLNCMNIIRKKHGVEPLSYKKELNNYAQKKADYFASKEGKLMLGSSPYGISLFTLSGGKKNGYAACKHWYEIGKNYNYGSGGDSSASPFTQMLWKNTHYNGVGVARNAQGKIIVVSVYDPPGNVQGEFTENVLEPIEEASTETEPDDSSTTPSTATHPTPVDESTPSEEPVKESTPSEKPADKSTPSKEPVNTTTEPHLSEHKSNMKLFRQQNLECHNNIRKHHGVGPLNYKPEMNDMAQKISQELAEGRKPTTPDFPFGQNVHSNRGKVNGWTACRSWYKGKDKYSFGNDSHSAKKESQLFTQMVWKDTKRTGIGFTKSSSGKTFVVALYNPPGNVQGEFEDNVKPYSE